MIEKCSSCSLNEIDNPDCVTCESLKKHNAIYSGLNNQESLTLFRERCNQAFESVLPGKELLKGGYN